MNLKQVFATKNALFGVCTDLEPDDIAALHVLAPLLRQQQQQLYCCVGEGNLSKVGLMKAVLAELQIHGATVIDSGASKKTYPTALIQAYSVAPAATTADPVQAAACIEALASGFENHVMLVFKPPRELLHLSASLLAKTTVCAYGSFNFRALGGAGMARFAELANGVIAHTVVYESFFVTGSENSLTTTTAPEFFAHARTHAPRLLDAIEAWNAHIAIDRLEAIRELSAQMIVDFRAKNWSALQRATVARGRAAKVVENIVAGRRSDGAR